MGGSIVNNSYRICKLINVKDLVFGLDQVGKKFPKNGDGKRNMFN